MPSVAGARWLEPPGPDAHPIGGLPFSIHPLLPSTPLKRFFGFLRASAPGWSVVLVTVLLSACDAGVTGSVSEKVAALEVTPSATVGFGETAQLWARATTESGEAIASPRLLWTSLDADIATVDSIGVVKGVGAGSVTIVVTAGDVRATIDVTVTPMRDGLTARLSTPNVTMWQHYHSPGQTLTVTRAPGITGAVRLSAKTSHPGITVRLDPEIILVSGNTARVFVFTTAAVPMQNHTVTVTAETANAAPATAVIAFMPRASVYKGEFFNVKHAVARASGCVWDRTLRGHVKFNYPSTVYGSPATMSVEMHISSVPRETKVGDTTCATESGTFNGSTSFTSQFPSMNGQVVLTAGGTYQFIYNGEQMTVTGYSNTGTLDINYDPGSARTTVGSGPTVGNFYVNREGQEINPTLP